MKHWYNNGKDTRTFDETSVPLGWKLGRIVEQTTEPKHWYNDGVSSQTKCFESQKPVGWLPGKLPTSEGTKQKISESNKGKNLGKHWYNNGIDDAIICFDNEVPDGYILGVLPEQKQHLQEISHNSAGKHRTEEQKLNQSIREKEYWATHPHPWIGRHHTEESKEKNRQSQLGRIPWNKGNHLTKEQLESRHNALVLHFGSLESYYKIQSDKSKQTKLEKYNNENYTNKEKALNTIKANPDFYKNRNLVTNQTCQEKYGVDWPGQIVEASFQRKETCMEKYGVEYAIQLKHNYKTEDSIPNLNFKNLLLQNNIIIDENNREFNLSKFIYDFKIDKNLIEINPTITHNTIFSPWGNGLDAEYHQIKSLNAIKFNYRCIHIWDWDDPQKIITQLLLPKQKIYARKCQIKDVDKENAKAFINKYHLQGYAKDEIRIGLYYDDELVSIMTFGKPRYNKNYQYELIRYCSSYNIIGGAEKLFTYFIKNNNPKSIISYCDLSKFNGNTYIKLGFNLKSEDIKPSCHWYNMKTNQHITDNLLRQRGFDQLFGTNYGKGTNNEELMLNAGFVKIYDVGQATYIKEFDINSET